MINKYKELLKNIGIFGISNLVTKIILFLMIPLYTNVLSSSEYGIIDIILVVLIVFCGLLGFSIAFIGSLPILLIIGLIYLIKIGIDEISNHR